MNILQVKSQFDKLSSAISITAPFIASLLRRVRIQFSSQVPSAGVNGRGVMLINPMFWEALDTQGRAWVLGHEKAVSRTAS